MSIADMKPGKIRLHQPTAEENKAQDALAPRLDSLNGKVIGLLNNTKDLVDELLLEVKALLQKEFPGAQFRDFRKESVSGASADMLIELARCDAVVAAVGD
jgi:hypothetical protein